MMQAGAASVVINNELGTAIQGASVNQVVKSIRDDLEANALCLADGELQVLLVSCDLAGLEADFVQPAKTAIAAATGVPADNVVIAGTHTHAGPSVIPTNYRKGIDEPYHERLGDWLLDVSKRAVDALAPAELAVASGSAQIGYNRRVCWDDGRHTMHGDLNDPHATGLEGPDDPQHVALFARNQDGKMIAVLHQNTSHPTCFYGADFLSADFPGVARAFLRDAMGAIPILYLNGAFGDISIEHQGFRHNESKEQKVRRAAHLVAGETLRLWHQAEFRDELVFDHARAGLAVPVRLPDSERLREARALLARVDAGEEIGAWEIMNAHGPVLLQERFGDDPVDHLNLHAIRLGDAAFVTQPCELYCSCGLDIKRRSPAGCTSVVGIADGYSGYCPTPGAIRGGGYSADPYYWARLVPEAGDMIVDCAAGLLKQLWLREER